MGGNFSLDENGDFYSTTTVYGYIKKPGITESYYTLMALLNSKLFWWFLKTTGTVLANGYFRFKPDYIKPFPVPNIETETANKIDMLVSNLIASKKQGEIALTQKIQSEIDAIWFTVYQLNEDDIIIVNF